MQYEMKKYSQELKEKNYPSLTQSYPVFPLGLQVGVKKNRRMI